MNKQIAAFTETGADATPISFPAYVNLSQTPDGRFMLTTRERGHNGMKHAEIEIPREELVKFAEAALDAGASA